MQKRLTTEQVLIRIKQSESVQALKEELSGELGAPSINACLYPWIQQAGMTLPQLFSLTGVERSMGYKVLSGKRTPGRDLLLSMALALHMDLESTQRLLAIGGKGALYPRSRRDMVIIHALIHGQSLEAVQEELISMGEAMLWSSESRKR